MDKQWYALSSKPHKENTIYRQLLEKEIAVYFPRIKVKPVNPRSSKIRPYFPGYLFVYVDLEECGINTFRWLPGARGLVSFGDEPSVVPPALISNLYDQLGPDGLFEEVPPSFKPGDKVRIHAGLFQGYEAIFDKTLGGSDRVQVLLTFLKQPAKPVQLSSLFLEPLI
ncbi:MAG: transcription termination/antitermination NusG family protein [Chloroflexota bacterium]